MRLFVSLFVGVVSVNGAGTSVMVCKGDFPARKSVCDGLSANLRDMVPSEAMSCSSVGSASQFASVLKGRDSSGWIPIDFASEGTISLSMQNLQTSPVDVSYDDCNSASSLPDLDATKRYLAVLLLDNQAAQGSLELNRATGDPKTRLEMRSSIKFYDTHLLADSNFRAQLADEFQKCELSTMYCLLKFNSLVISKVASLVMNSYI